MYVKSFILIHAKVMRHRTFQVTQIGCGIAGFSPEQIAPFFVSAPANCQFDIAWKPWLGDDRAYWGTHA
jgi:hypothetical protein